MTRQVVVIAGPSGSGKNAVIGEILKNHTIHNRYCLALIGFADRLIVSLATAKTHVRNILNKLAVDDRTKAAVTAMRHGLV